ncbi:hypothetical protein ACQFX9_28160 [Aliinostoc sp. HNIBRCY26]|uniref:hypothetical protein n=1 Tax=Aliinostoc sp. HNIBRCY26 TaxID=3418997 RepID=UPI003D014E25
MGIKIYLVYLVPLVYLSPVPSPQSPVPSPQSPVPSPQSPIPSPQSPAPNSLY